MAAPKGNRFWELRSSHGRNPIFKTPEQLWDACCEYFQWAEDNPLLEEKVFAYQGDLTRGMVEKMRAMTLAGLCLFLDIDPTTWKDYGEKKGFSHVTTRAERVIYSQKFSGAAADLLNANIIARDLGLRDKQDVEHAGAIAVAEMDPTEAANRITALLAAGRQRKEQTDSQTDQPKQKEKKGL